MDAFFQQHSAPHSHLEAAQTDLLSNESSSGSVGGCLKERRKQEKTENGNREGLFVSHAFLLVPYFVELHNDFIWL